MSALARYLHPFASGTIQRLMPRTVATSPNRRHPVRTGGRLAVVFGDHHIGVYLQLNVI